VEALRRRVDELTGAAAQIMRLESMVRDQRQTLRSKESEMQSLIEENSQLQSQLRSQTPAQLPVTPPSYMTTPTRSTMSLPATPYQPDTPSREVKLEAEPRGAEFEQLVKPITALARFSDKQKRQLFTKIGVA
jgi:hypothetical protein